MATSSTDRTQLPVLPLLLSAALVLLSAAAPICQAQPVLDANGDPVRSNNVYRLRFEAIGFFGGVTVFPNGNDTACARPLGLGEETDPGLPVWILPGGSVVGDAILKVSARSKIRIFHDLPANCADPWVWTAPGDETAQFRPVLAGMENGNPLLTNEWFEVRETEKARVYKLIYCRACLLCEVFCTAEVGLDNNDMLGVGGQPFPLRFVKVPPVAAAKGPLQATL